MYYAIGGLRLKGTGILYIIFHSKDNIMIFYLTFIRPGGDEWPGW